MKITIIGGGSGGYPAAIRAARLGAEVTLIEKDLLGGVCLNRGCIPTKSLLQTVSVIDTIRNSEQFGVVCKGYDVDFPAVMERTRTVSGQLRKGVQSLLSARKVTVVHGKAELLNRTTVGIRETGEKIASDGIVIATGSKPVRPPIEGIEGPRVWDSNDVLSMASLPDNAVIIGGGVIGCELSVLLATMGTKTTLLELMPTIIPELDEDISSVLLTSLEKRGIRVVNDARVLRIREDGVSAFVDFEVAGKEQTVAGERIVCAVGRRPDLEALNLDALGIVTESGAVLVDEYLETNVPGVYAVGDAIGGVMLAHLATAEGECAARNLLGARVKMNRRVVPSCIYTNPEIASVGLSEKQAGQLTDVEIGIGRFPFRGNSKALILSDSIGMVKVVAEKKYGEVLGVHVVGPHATDIIAEAVLGMSLEMTADELAGAIHPHPTLSEAIMEAGQTLVEGCIHMP